MTAIHHPAGQALSAYDADWLPWGPLGPPQLMTYVWARLMTYVCITYGDFCFGMALYMEEKKNFFHVRIL
jgi:hypothetical protein